MLAPDPDREGEAIAWHLTNVLDSSVPIRRIEFNEITQSAVEEAVKHPREIDQNMVNAQQARRILDRLVGYKISPLLWKKVQKGLSAGRVQSVAVRLISEREMEVQRFVPQEYWEIAATFTKSGSSFEFHSKLNSQSGKPIEIKNDQEAAKKIMLQIGVEDVDAEVANIIQSNQHDATAGNASEFFNAKHKKIIFLAFLIAFFNQVSGINFILYYAPEILEIGRAHV